jgi:hypothetical protein
MHHSQMDPAAVAKLRDILEPVDELWQRSILDLRLRPERSLAQRDDVLPEARFVRIHASQSLIVGLDHLMAWKVLVYGPILPVQAQATLLRSALEGSVRCRWLVDPAADPADRVARGWAAKRDDFEERRKFEAASKSPSPQRGKSAVQRLAELDEARLACGVRRVGFADTTSLMAKFGLLRIFRLTSAMAHGKEWVMPALARADWGSIETGVSGGFVAASDATLLGLTRETVRAIETAVVALENYYAPGPTGTSA